MKTKQKNIENELSIQINVYLKKPFWLDNVFG